ncbi:MAG: hypothetical protein IPI31_00085 [Bacteroidetes bacterium]|nr:hypothetical protein [Bacteroidota bacterium]
MKQITLILISILVTITGCDTTNRKNFVVLIDNSTSVPEQVMQRYIATIQETILPNIGDKDKLIVQFIDGCSQEKAERIYSFDLAEMNFENKADGVNHKADSSRARLKRYVNVTVKNDIAETILAKRKERKDCGGYTDIVNALNEAKKLVETKKSYSNNTDKIINDAEGIENFEYETCIVIFSDMVNENSAKTYDFTTFGKLKGADINKKVTELKDVDKIPDLAGVKVLIYGATSTEAAGPFAGKQIENVELFWDLFFHSAGAELKGYGYDTEIELKNYLTNE